MAAKIMQPVRWPRDVHAAILAACERSTLYSQDPLDFTAWVIRACRRDLAHAERSKRPKRRRHRNTLPRTNWAQL